MKIELTDEQAQIIRENAEWHHEDPDAFLATVVERMIQRERLVADLRKSTVNIDDSYEHCRRTVHSRTIGFTIGSGDGEGADEARDDLKAELEGVGLSSDVRFTCLSSGRSAEGVAILLEALIDVATFVGAVGGAVVVADKARDVVGRMVKAVRQAASKHRFPSYTAEFLKSVCIEDALEHLDEGETLDVAAMKVAATAGQFYDGSWLLNGPIYIVLPVPDTCTLLYVVNRDGDILLRQQLPYHGADEGMRSTARGTTSNLAPPSEAEALLKPGESE